MCRVEYCQPAGRFHSDFEQIGLGGHTMKRAKVTVLSFAFFLVICLALKDGRTQAQSGSTRIGEKPALEVHINESDIENNGIKFKKLLEIGEAIFAARWTKLDGQGRPAATGNGAPTKRDPSHDPGFIRTSGT